MRKHQKFLPPWALILVAAAFTAGCNIFEFAANVEKPPTEKAEEAIRNGEYAKAKEVLAEVVKDSTDAMALYLNAKATLLDAGIDLAKIAELVEGQENLQSGDNLAILAMIDDMDDVEKTAWYRSNLEVRANISKIWEGKTAGLLKKNDIALDFTVANMMSGVLGLRDTNRDGYINADDFQIDLAFIQDISKNAEGFNFDGAKIKNEDGEIIIDDVTGEPLKLEGLTVFLGEWEGSLPAQKVAAVRKYQPDDINPLLAFVMSLLDDGIESILYLLGDSATTFDPDQIEEYINKIAAIINYYWYDDGLDNDGDGRIDEETINGKDDDGDGFIDEDSDHHPADPTNVENTQFHHVFYKWKNR